MLFTEPASLFVFLPIVMAIARFFPREACNYALLALSLLFYAMGEPEHVLLLVLSSGFNYVAALVLESREPDQRRTVLVVAVGVNLALLVFFKYVGFLIGNLNGLFEISGLPPLWDPQIHLPLGISFFTFQAISYLMDVSSGQVKAERNPAYLALYISLFPQLVAGPIVRFSHIAEDLRQRSATVTDWAEGLRLFCLGLGRKMLIANSLGVTADAIFRLPTEQLSTVLAWTGVIAYALQIFFDFSGYSAMAIGIGRVLGFRFPRNFNNPYCATSIQDFWRRWHISLSTWFRDYLYIPLGGSRGGKMRTATNLAVVFLLCGLWHGASWNFVIWGVLHGAFLSIEKLPSIRRVVSTPIFNRCYALLVVLVGWVFFRCETLAQSMSYLKVMFFGGAGELPITLFVGPVAVVAFIFGALWATPFFSRANEVLVGWSQRTPARRYLHDGLLLGGVSAMLLLAVSQSASNTFNPFIYFRF